MKNWQRQLFVLKNICISNSAAHWCRAVLSRPLRFEAVCRSFYGAQQPRESTNLNFDLLWINTRCVKRNANVVFWKTTTHNICCEVIIREVGIVGENRWLSGTFCLLYSPGSLTSPGTRSLPSMFCLLYLGWAWLGYFWCSATFLLVINPQTQNLLHFAFYTSTTLSVAKAFYA